MNGISRVNLSPKEPRATNTVRDTHDVLEVLCHRGLGHDDTVPGLQRDVRLHHRRIKRNPFAIVEILDDAVHLQPRRHGWDDRDGPARDSLRPHQRAGQVGIGRANRALSAL